MNKKFFEEIREKLHRKYFEAYNKPEIMALIGEAYKFRLFWCLKTWRVCWHSFGKFLPEGA